MSTAVNNNNTNNNNNNNILFLKKDYPDVHPGKKDIVEWRLNWEMSWRIFPTIVSNISILTTHHLMLIVLRTHFSTWIHFFFSKNFTTNTITCKNAIFWCEFYIFICKNDNFIVLNKLLLKNQNVSEIVNAFIVKNNKHFLKLKEYFKRNALIYQRIYTSFCRVDDYDVKSKLAFNIASGGYKNQQENIHFIREMPIYKKLLKLAMW